MADHDILIVGGGLAGLTAGLFAARLGRSTLVLEPAIPGGHLANIEKVEDFPGFLEGIAGFELGPIVQEQAANAGAEFRMAEATGLARAGTDWLVRTSDGEVSARAIIVATGSKPRTLGIPGEDRLVGRGISHCASCDGPLMRGKPVGVVGGGDSALLESLTLANHASEVLLFHRDATFTGQESYLRRVNENSAITLRLTTIVEEVLGDDAVTGVRARHVASAAKEHIPLVGLFVYVGLEPNTSWLGDLLALDESGHILTDIWMRTALPGLFAAGDVRADSAAQAIASAGDGATAAIAAHCYIDTLAWPTI